MCHSLALRDCLGHKNALYKYLILNFSATLYAANVHKNFADRHWRFSEIRAAKKKPYAVRKLNTPFSSTSWR